MWHLERGRGAIWTRELISGATIEVAYGRDAYTIAASSDGAMLAMGAHDIRLRNRTTGEGVKGLDHGRSHISSMAFSHDNRRLASGTGDGLVQLWDVSHGTEGLSDNARIGGYRHKQIGKAAHFASVYGLSFSPDDSKLASASGDCTARLCDALTLETLAVIKHPDGAVESVSFSHDGSILASACNAGMVMLTDVATGSPLARIRHLSPVRRTVFSPCGTALAIGTWGGGKVHMVHWQQHLPKTKKAHEDKQAARRNKSTRLAAYRTEVAEINAVARAEMAREFGGGLRGHIVARAFWLIAKLYQ